MFKSQKQEANRQPQIKVCGLTKLSQIRELVDLKIDFLGFIFYEQSPRFVLNHLNVDEISKINHHGKVGVFVNENIKKIVEISEKADLNLIQIHGDENEDFISELRKKLNPNIGIIKVIRISPGFENQIKDEFQRFFTSLCSVQNDIDYFLFDTDSQSFGGTGKTFNWTVLNRIEILLPYFLSGGISFENSENIDNLKQKPFALDVNSKFEIEPGIKDLGKIKRFVITLKVPMGRPNKE